MRQQHVKRRTQYQVTSTFLARYFNINQTNGSVKNNFFAFVSRLHETHSGEGKKNIRHKKKKKKKFINLEAVVAADKEEDEVNLSV